MNEISAQLLSALMQREPLYHAAYPEATVAHFEAIVAEDFWEIGASGIPYSREIALNVLRTRAHRPAVTDWQTSDAALTAITADVVLLSYTLQQPGRTTKRLTLWRQDTNGWKAVFHQGTVVL